MQLRPELLLTGRDPSIATATEVLAEQAQAAAMGADRQRRQVMPRGQRQRPLIACAGNDPPSHRAKASAPSRGQSRSRSLPGLHDSSVALGERIPKMRRRSDTAFTRLHGGLAAGTHSRSGLRPSTRGETAPSSYDWHRGPKAEWIPTPGRQTAEIHQKIATKSPVTTAFASGGHMLPPCAVACASASPASPGPCERHLS